MLEQQSSRPNCTTTRPVNTVIASPPVVAARRRYGVDEHTCFLIDLAARSTISASLRCPTASCSTGRLTPEERAIMETHATAGADILAESKIPQMYVAEEIARHHHERFDARLPGAAESSYSARRTHRFAGGRIRRVDPRAALQAPLELRLILCVKSPCCAAGTSTPS